MPTGGKVQLFGDLSAKEMADFIAREIELVLKRKAHNCLSCLHFVHETQMCHLAGQMPPPRIAVIGCEKWDEEIPF